MGKKKIKTFLQVVEESRRQLQENNPGRSIDEIITPDIIEQMNEAVQERNRKAIESEILASKLILTD